MKTNVLVINCGSSSIKFQVVDPQSHNISVKGVAENIGSDRCCLAYGDNKELHPKASYQFLLEKIIDAIAPWINTLIAVGHRVVHGGEFFTCSVIIDDLVEEKIQNCSDLAPLHNPVNLLGIQVCKKHLPEIAHIAVFDTAFHTTMPKHAYIYPIDHDYYTNYKIRKYGFHGTSHRFVAQRAKQLYPNAKNLITAHLGNGCSISAIKNGSSIDTSMGLTPLEGLVMGTRSGDIDPSIVSYLSKKLSVPIDTIDEILNKKSGLLGLSKVSGDMRVLEEKALQKDLLATLAIDTFCYRLAKYIYSYHIPLGKIDGIVFTGGIGENSPYIREKVCDLLPHYDFDKAVNNSIPRGKEGNFGKNIILSVIPTNEELLIAQDAKALGANV